MILEFTLSLNFVPSLLNSKDQNGVTNYDKMLIFFKKYHTGIEVIENPNGSSNVIKLLFLHFLPKIFVLLTVVNLIQAEILMGLYHKKEEEKESIEKAYTRFMRGQYKIDIQGSIEVRDMMKNN